MNNEIIITSRQKVTFDDVFGMTNDDGKDWDVDDIVYSQD